MAKIFEKIHPKVVKMRKGITIAVLVVALLILVVIVSNINSSSPKNAKAANSVNATKKQQIKVTPDLSWIDNGVVRNSALSNTMSTSSASQNNTQNGQNKQNMQNAQQASTNTKQQTQALQQSAQDEQNYLKAKIAPITSNQITGNMASTPEAPNSSQNVSVNTSSGLQGLRPQEEDPNLQNEKRDFVKEAGKSDNDYLQETLKEPVSPYEVKAGTIIPAILITGINSDLPGQITGQVRSNVYDTVSGKYLMIPQGSKVIGLYDSQVAYGQERVLIIWKRIIMPNGKSVDLEGMPGVDMSGYAGFSDQVNNHYGKIFGSVILMSVISAGAQLSQPDDNYDSSNPDVSQTLAASLGTNIMNTTNSITAKNLGIQPTLEIRPGYFFNISVTKDIVLPGEYE